MKIVIEVIPHSDQRYNTVGDWQWEGDTLNIKVSDLKHEGMNFLIARHELDEAMLCRRYNVTQEQVDAYDLTHPEAGGDCLSDNLDAPYSMFHNDALAAEWQMARLLGIDWKLYSDRLEALTYKPEEKDVNETAPDRQPPSD